MQKSEVRMQNEEEDRVAAMARYKLRRGAHSTSAFCLLPSAFSFTEVLFAVIILGIGFIMIAAIFPVAIQQTKTTAEETTGATIARGAVNYIQSIATDALMLQTTMTNGEPGLVFAIPLHPAGANLLRPLGETIRGNVILPNDPRFGWVALYRRGLDGDGNRLPYAQVFVVAVTAPSGSSFSFANDVLGPSPSDNDPENLEARPVSVTLTDGGAGIDTAAITTDNFAAAAEGAYLIINDGRIYRLGNAIAGGFDLMPGSDMKDNSENGNFSGFIVGRSRTGEGPAMDIGVYTTFVKVN